jgi:hypothetical protein
MFGNLKAQKGMNGFQSLTVSRGWCGIRLPTFTLIPWGDEKQVNIEGCVGEELHDISPTRLSIYFWPAEVSKMKIPATEEIA